MNTIVIRMVAFVLVFLLVVTLPWWISVFVLAGCAIYFPFYLEILFFGFLFDTLYSVRYSFPSLAMAIAAGFLLVVMFGKTRVRT